MRNPKHLFIFRHGETDYNKEHRFQGHRDIPLNLKGFEQAKRLIRPLSQQQIEFILSSDLSRAYETATVVGDALRIKVERNSAYREAMLGEAEGLTVNEIREKFGEALTQSWRSSDLEHRDTRYPGGESGTEVMKRVTNAIHQQLKEVPFTKIGLATHGGVIRRLIHFITDGKCGYVPITNGLLYEVLYDVEAQKWELADFMSYNPSRSLTG